MRDVTAGKMRCGPCGPQGDTRSVAMILSRRVAMHLWVTFIYSFSFRSEGQHADVLFLVMANSLQRRTEKKNRFVMTINDLIASPV